MGLTWGIIGEFSTVYFVIHTVKGFGIVNEAEIDVFPELSRFFDDPEVHVVLPVLSLVPLPLLNPA